MHYSITDWFIEKSIHLTQGSFELVQRRSFHYGARLFGKYFIMLSAIIPISITVSMETIRFLQSLLIGSDVKLYSTEINQKAKAISIRLHEELGNIDVIFTDKTGTLTENVMKFRGCFVGNREYNGESNQYHHNFFSCLSICHDVHLTFNQQYEGASPDEEELVKFAAKKGYNFISSNSDTITLMINGSRIKFALLHKINFTSERKKMSFIVMDPENNVYVYTKGADSEILKSLALEQPASYINSIKDGILSYASKGYRVITIAYKSITYQQYQEWDSKYQIEMRKSTKDFRAIQNLENEMEKELTVIGCAALEDKLQTGVKETITALKLASIKIIMITGDRMDTAEAIGISSGLINPMQEVIRINSIDMANDFLSDWMDPIKISPNQQRVSMRPLKSESNNVCLIMTGEALTYSIKSLEKNLMHCLTICSSIIICRASPHQKSSVVNLFKKNTELVTLAIGDGGNDVPMLMTSHVGIGILGREGNQASSSSDYSIGQFRFLKRLLFIHGRWNMQRISFFICFSFYKSLIFILPNFWFGIYSKFSGMMYWDDFLTSLYSIVFTSCPIACYGLLHKDLSESIVEGNNGPELYKQNRDDKLCAKKFLIWTLLGIGHSVVMTLLPIKLSIECYKKSDSTLKLWPPAINSITAVGITQLLILMMYTKSYTFIFVINYFIFGLCTFLLYASLFGFRINGKIDFRGFKTFWPSTIPWLHTVVSIFACGVSFSMVRFGYRIFCSNLVDKLSEKDRFSRDVKRILN